GADSASDRSRRKRSRAPWAATALSEQPGSRASGGVAGPRRSGVTVGVLCREHPAAPRLAGGGVAGSWGGESRKAHPLQRVGFAGTMKKLPPTAPIRRTVMNRSTRDAVAFGLGFLTG